jgi:hypothetical protein
MTTPTPHSYDEALALAPENNGFVPVEEVEGVQGIFDGLDDDCLDENGEVILLPFHPDEGPDYDGEGLGRGEGGYDYAGPWHYPEI